MNREYLFVRHSNIRGNICSKKTPFVASLIEIPILNIRMDMTVSSLVLCLINTRPIFQPYKKHSSSAQQSPVVNDVVVQGSDKSEIIFSDS